MSILPVIPLTCRNPDLNISFGTEVLSSFYRFVVKKIIHGNEQTYGKTHNFRSLQDYLKLRKKRTISEFSISADTYTVLRPCSDKAPVPGLLKTLFRLLGAEESNRVLVCQCSARHFIYCIVWRHEEKART